MGAKQSAEMKEALRLITQEGMTAYAAAKLAGVTRQAISQSADYRKHIEGKQNAKAAQ